jgi:hypothetical protein
MREREGSNSVDMRCAAIFAPLWKVALYPLVMLASVTMIAVTIPPNRARADTAAALTAIADTADRICGIITTQGETGSNKVQGDIHAELNGLARRLATIGGSGKMDITSSNYQGLLQQDLSPTLKDIRECKLKVLQQLQAAVLPGTVQESGPGAPNAALLQAPANAPIIDSAKVPGQQDELGLYSCANQQTSITCYVILSRLKPGQSDYPISDQYKLVDNFHIEHRLRKAFFIDGLGTHQQTTNLSTGESIWLALEFETAARPVSSARIILPTFLGGIQLRGPVN